MMASLQNVIKENTVLHITETWQQLQITNLLKYNCLPPSLISLIFYLCTVLTLLLKMATVACAPTQVIAIFIELLIEMYLFFAVQK